MADLITVARAQQNAALGAADSTLLQTLITAASGMVERYCDRLFTADDYVEIVDGNGLAWIEVKNPPINSLTSVVVVDCAGTSYTISSSNLQYDSTRGIITFAEGNSASVNTFLKGNVNATITYNGGWSTIPPVVQEAVVQVCLNLFSQSADSGNPNFISERLGEYQYSKGALGNMKDVGPITPMVAALLDSYVLFRRF